jgi:MoaA/NifB/PqqE/SkfB family radical SAM enzyme
MGGVQPCCSTDFKHTNYGNIRDFDSAQELMNSQEMKQLRKDMLMGVKNPSCSTCHREDQSGLISFRNIKNQLIDEMNIDVSRLIKNTRDDGHLEDFAMQYWDIRFSNICNLKCRMCGVKYSHTWGQDAVALNHIQPRKNFVFHAHDDLDFKDYVSKYGDLTQLKEVYFAGGESLMQKDHWDMLDHLVDLGIAADIRLVYNTNLTKLNFGKRDLTNYIERFKTVCFIVSVDAVGDLFEYIRTGASWSKLLENLEIIKRYENVSLKFNCAVSIYNILDLTDLIAFAQTQNYQDRDLDWVIDLSPVHFPKELSITLMPEQLKDLAQQRLESSPYYTQLKNSIDGIIKFMRSGSATKDQWMWAIEYAKQIDALRSENILDLVPELKNHWTYADISKSDST